MTGKAPDCEKTFVVNSALSVLGYWLLTFIVGVLPLTFAVCSCSILSMLPGWNWEALWPAGIILVAGILVSLIAFGEMRSAQADSTGLTVQKAWRPSTRKQVAWANVRTLEIEQDTRRRRRSWDFTVKITCQDGSLERVISCPYDIALFRAIIAHAQLNLQEEPENWQAEADDPFEAIKHRRPRQQKWYWTRS